MPQCKAATTSGTQCASEIAAPSRSLCKRHQAMLSSGKPVRNVETGRAFPASAAGTTKAPAKATAASKAATARVATTRRPVRRSRANVRRHPRHAPTARSSDRRVTVVI